MDVRLASAAIWKSAADDKAKAFSSIAKRFERETDCEVRVTMLSALNELAETGGQWLDQLSSIRSSTTSIREKFYAAAYLAVRQRDSTPDDVGTQLAEAYANFPEAQHPVEVTNLEEPEELYWAAVQAMGPSRGVACLGKTLELWNYLSVSWDARRLLKVVELLLRLASNDNRRGWGGTSSSRGPTIQYFGIEPPSINSRWLRSPEAGVALNAIANKAELWQIETNLLGLFGLPSARDELRELARRLPPAARG